MTKDAKNRDRFEELMDELARPSTNGRSAKRCKEDVLSGREEAARCMTLPCADLTCPCRVVNKKDV